MAEWKIPMIGDRVTWEESGALHEAEIVGIGYEAESQRSGAQVRKFYTQPEGVLWWGADPRDQQHIKAISSQVSHRSDFKLRPAQRMVLEHNERQGPSGTGVIKIEQHPERMTFSGQTIGDARALIAMVFTQLLDTHVWRPPLAEAFNLLALDKTISIVPPQPVLLSAMKHAEPRPVKPRDGHPVILEWLPDWWDEQRKIAGKLDASFCAAELRVVLGADNKGKINTVFNELRSQRDAALKQLADERVRGQELVDRLNGRLVTYDQEWAKVVSGLRLSAMTTPEIARDAIFKLKAERDEAVGKLEAAEKHIQLLNNNPIRRFDREPSADESRQPIHAYGIVPPDVHERGWQWRPSQEDTAFAPPFGTIRVCIGCGCLVAGGPSACTRCAEYQDEQGPGRTCEQPDQDEEALEEDYDELLLERDNLLSKLQESDEGRELLEKDVERLTKQRDQYLSDVRMLRENAEAGSEQLRKQRDAARSALEMERKARTQIKNDVEHAKAVRSDAERERDKLKSAMADICTTFGIGLTTPVEYICEHAKKFVETRDNIQQVLDSRNALLDQCHVDAGQLHKRITELEALVDASKNEEWGIMACERLKKQLADVQEKAKAHIASTTGQGKIIAQLEADLAAAREELKNAQRERDIYRSSYVSDKPMRKPIMRRKTVYVARSGLGPSPEWESQELPDEDAAKHVVCARAKWKECWLSDIGTASTGEGFFRCYASQAERDAGSPVDAGPVILQRNVEDKDTGNV